MIRPKYLATLVIAFAAIQTSAQTSTALRARIEALAASKDATVGLSVIANNGGDTLSFNGDHRLPMQSVFKLPIAVALLCEIDKGSYDLEEPVTISREELQQDTWSPIKANYPDGATLPLSEILRYTLSESDNIGCDVQLRLLGGTARVEAFVHGIGVKDMEIKATEEQMHAAWDVQFRNWATAKAMSAFLALVYNNTNSLLSPESHAFLWKTLCETTTGANRIKGDLPQGSIVAHKTGSSGTNPEGITAATNDVGVVLLPNGEPMFISVFIADSSENSSTNEALIAAIARLAYDCYSVPK